MNTISTEDYLKEIFEIESDLGFVPTNLLAKHLKVSPPSATEMIKKFAKNNLIIYKPYKGAKLTNKGNIIALKIIRKHRLWEMFLVKILNFKWDEIHDEAENFEHIMTEQMENKIDAILNYPTHNPHGAPIPSKNGKLLKTKCIKLSLGELNSEYEIIRVHDDKKFLSFLASIDLKLNSKIKLVDKLSSDNSLLIKNGNENQIIPSTIAEKIFVERI